MPAPLDLCFDRLVATNDGGDGTVALAGPPSSDPGAAAHSGLVDLFTVGNQDAIVHSALGVISSS